MTREEIEDGIRRDAADLAILKRDLKFLVDRAARYQEQIALADKALGRITGATCDVPDESAFTSNNWPTFDAIRELCGECKDMGGKIARLEGRLRSAGVDL